MQENDWRLDAQRPSLTPMFVMGVLVWAGCASAYMFSARVQTRVCTLVAMVCLALVLLGLVIVLKLDRARMPYTFYLLAFVLGIALGCAQAFAVHDGADTSGDWFESPLVVTLDSDPSQSGEREKAWAHVECGAYRPLVLLMLPADTGLLKGERIETNASFKAADFQENGYLWSRGAVGTIQATRFEVLETLSPLSPLMDVRKHAIAALEGSDVANALLQAVVCGYRRQVEETDDYARFQTVGLAHLIAVSGAHLVIVTGLAATALRAARFRRSVSIAILSMFICAFLLLSGLPVSAIRAAVMAVLGLLSYFGRRRASSLNALGIGIVLLVALDPVESVSVSFCLSCLSTAGIVLFSPLFKQWFRTMPFGSCALVVDSLSLTLSASLASQLYASSVFGTLPLVSPFANIACTPLFPPLCALGLIGSIASLSGFAGSGIIVTAATLVAHALIAVVEACACLPYACVPFSLGTGEAVGMTVVACTIVWFAWDKIRVRSVAAGCLVCVVLFFLLDTAAVQADSIVMLDVGQGDAVLVRSRGQSLLVDTGNQDSLLVKALGRQRVRHIDSVLITHADDDHFGSLDVLARCVDVTRVLVAADMLHSDDESCKEVLGEANEAAQSTVGLELGDCFSVGAFTCEVVWPHAYRENGGNADSVCLFVSYDGDLDGKTDVTMLMTGDAEQEEIAAIVDEQGIESIDVLKVGHHGSRNGLAEDQAAQLRPAISLIGVGAHNRYGHPSPQTVSLLESVGSTVFRTDLNGDVTCRLNASGIEVSTMK